MSAFKAGLDDAERKITGQDTRPAISFVIENYKGWSVPTAKEREEFFALLTQWMASELKKDLSAVKASADARIKVIKQINESCNTYGRAAFADIDPNYFAVELALRVRMPRLIDQGQTGLCGAASVMYSFAKVQPAQYAKFALGLFFRGKGKFNNTEIEPSETIKAGYSSRYQFMDCPIDYVTLVSLRACSLHAIATGPLRAADETTMPGQVGQWLERAGYKGVESDTFFNANWIEKIAINQLASTLEQPIHHGGAPERTLDMDAMCRNLQKAADALAAGKFVILFTDIELSKYLSGEQPMLAPRTSSTSLTKHHFVAARRLRLTANDVTVRLITWANAYDKTIPLSSFLPRYNGYIAAQP